MRRALLSLSALTVSLAVLTGCGNPANKLCKKSAECDPDYSEEQCRDDYEELEEAADELGCSDVLNDFVKCAAKEGECVDGYVQADACTSETLAYFDCFFGDYTFEFGTTYDSGY